MEKTEFMNIFGELQKFYKKQLSPEQIDIYYTRLKNKHPDQLKRAMNDIIDASKTWPSINEIKCLCQEDQQIIVPSCPQCSEGIDFYVSVRTKEERAFLCENVYCGGRAWWLRRGSRVFISKPGSWWVRKEQFDAELFEIDCEKRGLDYKKYRENPKENTHELMRNFSRPLPYTSQNNHQASNLPNSSALFLNCDTIYTETSCGDFNAK